MSGGQNLHDRYFRSVQLLGRARVRGSVRSSSGVRMRCRGLVSAGGRGYWFRLRAVTRTCRGTGIINRVCGMSWVACLARVFRPARFHSVKHSGRGDGESRSTPDDLLYNAPLGGRHRGSCGLRGEAKVRRHQLTCSVADNSSRIFISVGSYCPANTCHR